MPRAQIRRRRAALALATALVAPVGTSTAAPGDEVTLTPLGTFSTDAFAESAAEIVTYDARTERAFVVNAHQGTIDVLDISDPSDPEKVETLDAPGANSVDVHDGLVAVAQEADTTTENGVVSFFDGESLERTGRVTVGALPDMLTFTPDGQHVLVANEGEPEGYCDGQVDPEGSVSVVDMADGAEAAEVRTADFRSFDGQKGDLREAGVRIFGPGASVAQDLEPEYIAPKGDGSTAMVTLQENNAVGILDIASATITEIVPLGLKDHGTEGQGIDPSDRDDEIAIAPHPVKGMFMPDAVEGFTAADGEDYVVTANEGDAREYDCYEEEERVEDLDLDPAVFPDAEELQEEGALGRLTVTTTAPEGADGFTELHAFGGRSVSVLDAAGQQVWDSGDQLEQLVAERRPEDFNSDNEENDSFDDRSDNKGPEPEGLDIGSIGDRTYAFVGLERDSGIVVVDVTDPSSAQVVGDATNRDVDGDPEAGTAGDLGPEGLHFVPAEDSPTDEPLLLVGNEVSGTTTIWQVDAPGNQAPEKDPGSPGPDPTDDAGEESPAPEEETSEEGRDEGEGEDSVQGPVIETDLP